jgi:hypothetical protein
MNVTGLYCVWYTYIQRNKVLSQNATYPQHFLVLLTPVVYPTEQKYETRQEALGRPQIAKTIRDKGRGANGP